MPEQPSRGIVTQTERPAPSSSEVEGHLRAVLSSTAFKASQRSKDFLAFVVERTLRGDTASLHERVIAVDLLGRPPAFDPADDAIVRVQANEVRKRLLRFYEAEGGDETIRIHLPIGGYIPHFGRVPIPAVSPPVEPALPVESRVRRLWWAAPVALIGLAGLAYELWPQPKPIESIWQPVVEQRNPAIICIPGLRALKPESGSELARALDATPPSRSISDDVFFQPGTAPLHLQDDYVGMGASIGALRIATHLAQISKPTQIRIGQDISFADLKSHPTILLGAFSSTWTLEMNREVPFIFVREQGRSRIREVRPPHRTWSAVGLRLGGRAEEDYAIAARLIDSTSGQVIFIAAGFTTFGTQCAAECLVDTSCIGRLTASAPRGWESKNLQAVLHTRILGNTPSPARLVAVQYW